MVVGTCWIPATRGVPSLQGLLRLFPTSSLHIPWRACKTQIELFLNKYSMESQATKRRKTQRTKGTPNKEQKDCSIPCGPRSSIKALDDFVSFSKYKFLLYYAKTSCRRIWPLFHRYGGVPRLLELTHSSDPLDQYLTSVEEHVYIGHRITRIPSKLHVSGPYIDPDIPSYDLNLDWKASRTCSYS